VRAPVIIVAAWLAVAVTACSAGGPATVAPPIGKAVAETMITGQLATTVGLGPLAPTCDDPGPLAVGTTFSCTAVRKSDRPGEPIRIQGTVNPDGHLSLVTSNLISAVALPSFERQAAAQLNQSAGSTFTPESVDCGQSSVVVPGDNVLRCGLVMPASGQIYDLDLTITDLNGRHFSLRVSQKPRS
jgi:hypothetical protein